MAEGVKRDIINAFCGFDDAISTNALSLTARIATNKAMLRCNLLMSHDCTTFDDDKLLALDSYV